MYFLCTLSFWAFKILVLTYARWRELSSVLTLGVSSVCDCVCECYNPLWLGGGFFVFYFSTVGLHCLFGLHCMSMLNRQLQHEHVQ